VSADALLDRLDKAKRTAPGKWSAKCPAHDDKGPSLAVRELDDGRVLVHCFAGCGVDEILGAVGLGFDALYPPKPIDGAKPIRRPWIPSDAFECARLEVGVAAIIAADMLDKRTVSEADYARLARARVRLAGIAEAAYGNR